MGTVSWNPRPVLNEVWTIDILRSFWLLHRSEQKRASTQSPKIRARETRILIPYPSGCPSLSPVYQSLCWPPHARPWASRAGKLATAPAASTARSSRFALRRAAVGPSKMHKSSTWAVGGLLVKRDFMLAFSAGFCLGRETRRQRKPGL